MPKRSNVLIVSASAGAGHMRAAEALRENFVAQSRRGWTEHVDILELAPRWVRHAYGGGFELVAAHAPWMWRELYSLTDGPRPDLARWGPLAERLLFRAFRRLAENGDWDLILCTHFLPCQLAARRRDLPPFALAVTDYTLHRYWVQPGVSRYFVATDELAAELRQRTHAPVLATGIPVATAFADARCERGTAAWHEHRRAFRLDPAVPVVLVMGGGLGLGVETAATAARASGIDGVRLIVVCGGNTAARDRLLACGFDPGRVTVLGRVDNVHQLMATADVVLTKPGGLTTTEALVVGRPLLLSRPLPGHEEGNARALEACGAALAAYDPGQVSSALQRMLREPGLLTAMTSAAALAGRADAGRRVAANALRLITRRAAA